MNIFKSIFTDVANAEHSTAAWLEKTVMEIEGKAPQIDKVIDTTLEYVGLVLQTGLDAMGNVPGATLVGTVVTKARTALSVASALVTDLGPTPTAASAFADVQANLSAVLGAAQVTNKTTVAAVTKAVSEIGVLGAAVSTAASAIAAAAQQPAVGQTAAAPAGS
jgi:hypothetical protein